MDISLPPLPEPIPTNSPSLRGKLLIFSLSVLLLISLVGSGWLFTENQKLRSNLQDKLSVAMPDLPIHTQQLSVPDEDRIGTDPKSEVIPRLFKIFQQEDVKMDPFPCIYQDICRTEVYQDGQFFWALNATRLNLYLQTNEEATQYYDRIASIFTKNSYILQPETRNKLQIDGTKARRMDIIHPEKEIACNATLLTIEGEPGSSGRTELGYPIIQLSCVNLDERNVNYISLQKALIKDLVLTADNNLFVNSYTENYAMISNSGTCMILKKSDGVWTVLDSSGCSDPSWNAREGSLSTVLRRDYGIPPEDAEVLAN